MYQASYRTINPWQRERESVNHKGYFSVNEPPSHTHVCSFVPPPYPIKPLRLQISLLRPRSSPCTPRIKAQASNQSTKASYQRLGFKLALSGHISFLRPQIPSQPFQTSVASKLLSRPSNQPPQALELNQPFQAISQPVQASNQLSQAISLELAFIGPQPGVINSLRLDKQKCPSSM